MDLIGVDEQGWLCRLGADAASPEVVGRPFGQVGRTAEDVRSAVAALAG